MDLRKALKKVEDISMRKYLSKKENVKKIMFFVMCALVLMQPEYFYASQAGLNTVTGLMNNLYQLVATFFSGIGMTVALLAVGEIGASWMGAGHGGNAQFEAFKRMGGAIFYICAPQIVVLFAIQ